MARVRVGRTFAYVLYPLRSVSTETAASNGSSGNVEAALGNALRTTGGASTSRPDAPPLRVLFMHENQMGFYHHPGFLNSLAMRPPGQRPGLRSGQWMLPFLMGSGCTALGFAAYGTLQAPSNPMTTHLSFGSTWLKWPWRQTSMASAEVDPGLSGLVLPPLHLTTPDTSTLPPLLPPASPLLQPLSLSAPAAASSGASTSSASLDAPAQIGIQPPPGATSASAGPVGLPLAPLTRGSISDAAARAAPSVVHLVVVDGSNHLIDHTTHGSGFVYDSAGYILTNAHVVAPALQTGNTLLVTLQDGQPLKGRVLCLDRSTDLAVVHVDPPASGQLLPAAECGSSAQLRAGEWVVALGSPLMLRHSVTAGIVSCVERRGCELGLPGASTSYIQTDAAVSQGSSGGPLLNLDGQVVGISVMKAVAADGVSFAIPIDAVRDIVRQFHSRGRVVRPFVGVTLVEMPGSGLLGLRSRLPGLPEGLRAAVVVQRVADGSPAAAAGLQPEDVLLAVAGERDLSIAQVIDKFGGAINQPVELQVLRRGPGGEVMQLTRHLVPKEAGPQ